MVILITLTLLAAFLAMVPYIVLEWWQWRKLQRKARLADSYLTARKENDFLEMLQIVASPITYKISTVLTKRISSPRKKILIRWYFAYLTHPPALLVLAISLAAFLSCLLQLVLLREVQKAAPEFVQDVSNLENIISAKIQNATAFWVQGTNERISQTEQFINGNLLGWARDGTQSLNNTLNTCNPPVNPSANSFKLWMPL